MKPADRRPGCWNDWGGDCWSNAPEPPLEDPPPLEEIVPGRRLETAEGSCYLVRTDYPVSYRYGGKPLEAARAVAGPTLAALARDPELADLTLDQACFLDTETTGLAGGTGTHVFMVGLGYFDGDYFRIDQYFMEDYDEEPGLVAALEESLRGFGAVVSFNGKAFDLPLIATRFILSRRRPPLSGRPHLDLLFPARRLWGARLASCRLGALEDAVLGETRVGDLPGRLVPEHYFRYLRTRDPRMVKPIFDHNRQDVISLLGLAGRAAERYETFLGDTPRETEVDALELYGLARLYRALGHHEPAARCYRACLEAGPPEPLAERAGLECVRLLRRLGRTDEATRLCERLADGYPRRIWALVELAKDLEHRLRDYDRALAVVDRAHGLVETAGSGSDAGAAPDLQALEWRRARIERKRGARASAGAASRHG